MPAIRVSALGTDAVVDGCLAAGTELAWGRVMIVLPTAPAGDGARPWPGSVAQAGHPSAQVGGSVEVEDGAAGPLGLGGGQVDDGGRDLLRRRDPVERALRPDLLPAR